MNNNANFDSSFSSNNPSAFDRTFATPIDIPLHAGSRTTTKDSLEQLCFAEENNYSYFTDSVSDLSSLTSSLSSMNLLDVSASNAAAATSTSGHHTLTAAAAAVTHLIPPTPRHYRHQKDILHDEEDSHIGIIVDIDNNDDDDVVEGEVDEEEEAELKPLGISAKSLLLGDFNNFSSESELSTTITTSTTTTFKMGHFSHVDVGLLCYMFSFFEDIDLQSTKYVSNLVDGDSLHLLN